MKVISGRVVVLLVVLGAVLVVGIILRLRGPAPETPTPTVEEILAADGVKRVVAILYRWSEDTGGRAGETKVDLTSEKERILAL